MAREVRHRADDGPADPSRRRLFRNLAHGGNPNAPHRAPWHRVPDVAADAGDVLWSGWATVHEVFVVGDEGMILNWDGTEWQRMLSDTLSALYNI